MGFFDKLEQTVRQTLENENVQQAIKGATSLYLVNRLISLDRTKAAKQLQFEMCQMNQEEFGQYEREFIANTKFLVRDEQRVRAFELYSLMKHYEMMLFNNNGICFITSSGPV